MNRYISKLDEQAIESIVSIIEPANVEYTYAKKDDIIELKIGVEYDGTTIYDYYEVSDYNIEAWDVDLYPETVRQYREFLYRTFGEEYAVEYLLNFV